MSDGDGAMRKALEKIVRATADEEPDNSPTSPMTEFEHALERSLWVLGQTARAALFKQEGASEDEGDGKWVTGKTSRPRRGTTCRC